MALQAIDQRLKERDLAFIVEMKEELKNAKQRRLWKRWEKLRTLRIRLDELREAFKFLPPTAGDNNTIEEYDDIFLRMEAIWPDSW